jgi:mRNA interferase MazF
MGLFTAGEVLLVHFPFSDLTASKLRPAVVLAEAGRGDWILCQITSKPYSDPKAIDVDSPDFESGSLRLPSFVRPGKLFTAHVSLVAGKIGKLHGEKFLVIRDVVIKMIQQS